MKLLHFIRLLIKNALWVALVPVICVAAVYWLTRNMTKEYISQTTLYTGVASGYSITSDEDQRVDYFGVNNAFDNLIATAKSRETIEQVALHLLAEDLLLKRPDYKNLDVQGFDNLHKIAPASLIQKAQSLGDSQSVFRYVEQVYKSRADNPIARILDGSESYYSIDNIRSALTITRLNTSDMLQVVCTCDDPAVCMRTLQLHSQIFIEQYKDLKVNQTSSAVEYFEKKLADVTSRLQKSEDDLKVFGQQNQVINYYEQTRYIAEQKEELDKTIYHEKADRDASAQALKLIESKLNDREKQITNSTRLIGLRQSLSTISANIEVAKVYENQPKVDELTRQKALVEDSIKKETTNYNNLSYSLETVPRTDLIKEWVDNAVALDKSNASLNVLTNKRTDYLDEYNEYAPLGSTLKRLDRQIDINEQEFLSILHGLNLARLRQSSISLSSNIVVIDSPFFPLEPQASKRSILVIASFLVAFIVVASVIIGKELLDSSMRTPERAKKIIGLPLAGVTLATDNTKAGLTYKVPLANILTEQMVNTLLPFIAKSVETNDIAQATIVTTRDDVYKEKDIQILHKQLSSLYNKAHWVVPSIYEKVFAEALPKDAYSIYKPAVEQLNYKTPGCLVNEDLSDSGLVIYVSPNISRHPIPTAILKASTVNVLAFNARDTWQAADREFYIKTREFDRSIPYFTWLVNTSDVNIDGFVGEVPKQRSWVRRKVKKALTLNLK